MNVIEENTAIKQLSEDKKTADSRNIEISLDTPIIEDSRGVAYIAGTKMKVRYIVIEATLLKRTPEEIQDSHEHLSLAQIHSALEYYKINKEKIEAEIEAAGRYVEEQRNISRGLPTYDELQERLMRMRTV